MSENVKPSDNPAPSASHYYAAIREQAERTVEQWDNHDQFRETEADKALNDPRIGEPSDVAIARHFLQLLEASEQALGSGFQSHAANGVVESAVKCYRGDFAAQRQG